MIASFHLIAVLVYEYFTPEWQRNVRVITGKVIDEMFEAN